MVVRGSQKKAMRVSDSRDPRGEKGLVRKLGGRLGGVSRQHVAKSHLWRLRANVNISSLAQKQTINLVFVPSHVEDPFSHARIDPRE